MKWLHLSDIHECHRDHHHRNQMYEQIVANTRERAGDLDTVFITGDLANFGSAAEYELLEERLINPLRAVLPVGLPIYTVPGNHDVDRKRSLKPRVWIIDPEERTLFQQVDQAGQQKRIDVLLPRFEAYRKADDRIGAWGSDWLASEAGSICKVLDIQDRKVALVGINTAWLCQDNHDSGTLTPGRYMVEAALDAAANTEADLTIVLGHHPLSSFSVEGDWADGDRVRDRLEQANAVYLHGHLHSSEVPLDL